MSSQLEEMLGPVERDIRKGRNISRPIRTPEELARFFREAIFVK